VAIDRRPLRDFILADVLERLNAGQLPAGGRVDELALAAELEVSRTPVREALSQLAYEGILEMRVGRGFRVAPLVPKDIEESYSVIVALEQFALSSVPSLELPQLAATLEEAAVAMELVADLPIEAQKADDAWHELLIGAAGNRRLIQVVARLKQAVRRAEYQTMSSRESVLRSVTQHRAIADALRQGDVARAADTLDHNWRDGLSAVLLQHAANGSEANGSALVFSTPRGNGPA
jgi:DNA-binding GntR family transcriptional regulator